MHKQAVLYLILGTFLFLSGCIGIEKNATVDTDGMVDIDMSIRISAAMAGMAKNGDGNVCPSQPQELEKEGFSISTSRTTDEKDIICKVRLNAALDKLTPLVNNAEDIWIQIVKLEDRYRVTYKPNSKDPIDKEQPFYQMLLAATNGYSLIATITAPRIIATSGKISEDKKSARVAMPTAMILTNSEDPIEHWIEFSLSEPSFIDRLLGSD